MGASYKILIVDDEGQVRDFVASLFSNYGHRCETARDGAEACFRQIPRRQGTPCEEKERRSKPGQAPPPPLSCLEFPVISQRDHMQNFLNCMRNREKPTLNADLAYRVMVAIGLSVESYRKNKVMRFDPVHQVSGRVRAAMEERGLFTRINRDILLFAPPLIITPGQVDQLVNITREAIAAVLPGKA
jgi:CheY-like chemotaxis protein